MYRLRKTPGALPSQVEEDRGSDTIAKLSSGRGAQASGDPAIHAAIFRACQAAALPRFDVNHPIGLPRLVLEMSQFTGDPPCHE